LHYPFVTNSLGKTVCPGTEKPESKSTADLLAPLLRRHAPRCEGEGLDDDPSGGCCHVCEELPFVFAVQLLIGSIEDLAFDTLASGRVRHIALRRLRHQSSGISFVFDRLLSLRDTIPDSEMHKPKMLTTTTTPANTVALIGSIHMFLEEPQRYRDEGPEIASAIHYRWEYCLLVDRLMTELGLQAPRNRICLLWSQYAWDDEADWHMPKEERKQRWETITEALHIGPRRTEEKR